MTMEEGSNALKYIHIGIVRYHLVAQLLARGFKVKVIIAQDGHKL